ncbi:hypothetical protein SAMN02745247_01541 [Butyrivibrio hungatei DSM 14810]|uniref:Uncharacterized protein n=1 Tax=Butyrivibrio hungatei DSM 14810 TaxID=1121132 RepID=A0A1M7SDU3_9FIRM|nr:retron St85 family effector protein [Butyrivibrio hungatei]SHN56635.1 hypothetical protein SAMN02745247_01541 [Butyrivibrio hungatei DSM 14810]
MNEKIINEIYHDIYCRIYENHITIFLCGGTDTDNHRRDKLRDYLVSQKKNISVLYPEDLLIEMLNGKQKDLVYLEQKLAENCDIIILFCESPGSMAELGSFVTNESIIKKLVVLIHAKHKNDKSYIMYGPANLVKANKESSLIFYNNDFSKMQNEIDHFIKKAKVPYHTRRNIDTIVGLFNFVIILLYFYDTAESKEIINEIIKLSKKIETDTKQIKLKYSMVIRWLYKERLIEKKIDKTIAKLALTQDGYNYAKRLIHLAINNIGEYNVNGIRIRILKDQYY